MSPLYEESTPSKGNSSMSEKHMAHTLAGDFTLRSMAEGFVKDRNIVLGSARLDRLPRPLTATAYLMFLQAPALRLGAEDNSAVIEIFSGIGLPRLAEV